VLLITLLVALHFYLREKLNRQPLFYVSWFILFIIPGMSYFPNFYNFCYEHVDHRTYLVCFGLLLLLLNLVQLLELDRAKHFRAMAIVLLGYLAGTNLLISGSYRNPTEFSRKAISTNPNSALAYSIYGTEMFLQGNIESAFDNLNSSLKICSKFLPALHYRARVFRQKGANREALADLDTLLATDPEYDADDYELRALIRIDMKEYDGAIRDYRTALRLNPQHAAARKGLMELERTVRSGRLLPEVVTALTLNQEGVKAGEQGDFRSAEAFFKKALSADPGFYGANINLGNALYQQGRIAEACAAWDAAAGHDPDAAAELLKEYCRR
jgi:tetratricopeptide (TPR) repeat protein